MSNTTLYTNDENTANGIREASFEEILDAARRALAKRVRKGTGFTSPRVTADYLRVRLAQLDHEVFCVIYLTLCVLATYVQSLHGTAEIA